MLIHTDSYICCIWNRTSPASLTNHVRNKFSIARESKWKCRINNSMFYNVFYIYIEYLRYENFITTAYVRFGVSQRKTFVAWKRVRHLSRHHSIGFWINWWKWMHKFISAIEVQLIQIFANLFCNHRYTIFVLCLYVT